MKQIMQKLKSHFGGVNFLILMIYTAFVMVAQVFHNPQRSAAFSVVTALAVLLVMGTVDVGGSGCVCPEHVMLKSILSALTYRKNDVVIMDMEAGLEHLGRGIGTLVVFLGSDGCQQIPLFALHKAFAEHTVLRERAEHQLLQKFQHGNKNLIPGQGIFFFHQTAAEACDLIVTHPAHQGADGCAIEFVQMLGNGAQIRMLAGAPQQHCAEQGIEGALLLGHGTNQLQA